MAVRGDARRHPVVAQLAALQGWISQRWPGTGAQAEIPIEACLANGQVVKGQIDLLLDAPACWILIDHKANPRGSDAWEDVARRYSGQLKVYKDAIELATSRPVAEVWLYFPVAAGAISVGVSAVQGEIMPVYVWKDGKVVEHERRCLEHPDAAGESASREPYRSFSFETMALTLNTLVTPCCFSDKSPDLSPVTRYSAAAFCAMARRKFSAGSLATVISGSCSTSNALYHPIDQPPDLSGFQEPAKSRITGGPRQLLELLAAGHQVESAI